MGWLARRREVAVRARLLREAGRCAACGHAWSVHPGAWPDLGAFCEGCELELAHGRREAGAPPCARRCPLLTVAQVRELEESWARIPDAAVDGAEAAAWAALDSWFAGVVASQACSQASVHLLAELANDRDGGAAAVAAEETLIALGGDHLLR